MLGHGTKFRHKKEQAITALLSHKNVDTAARAVGIGATTLQRWMKDPEFDAALQEARCTVFHESIARLQEAAGAAVTTVLKIMLDSKVPAATRLRATEVVLSQGAKATEMDIEARVAELERARSGQRSRRGATIVTVIQRQGVPVPATTLGPISAVPTPLAGPNEEMTMARPGRRIGVAAGSGVEFMRSSQSIQGPRTRNRAGTRGGTAVGQDGK